MRFLLLGVALLAAGCVPGPVPMTVERGKWKDYRDMSRGVGALMVQDQSAPDDVKARFSECFADYVVKAFTPEELARLDAYARGDAELSAAELRKYDEASKQRINGTKLTNASLDRFDTTCPQDVPDFKRYLSFR